MKIKYDPNNPPSEDRIASARMFGELLGAAEVEIRDKGNSGENAFWKRLRDLPPLTAGEIETYKIRLMDDLAAVKKQVTAADPDDKRAEIHNKVQQSAVQLKLRMCEEQPHHPILKLWARKALANTN